MKQIRFNVSQKDINTTSNFMSVLDCAIAKAAKRKFPSSTITVGGFAIYIDGERYDFLPAGVAWMRNALTRELPVVPVSIRAVSK